MRRDGSMGRVQFQFSSKKGITGSTLFFVVVVVSIVKMNCRAVAIVLRPQGDDHSVEG